MSLLSPLDRKLLRDLWRIKGQAAAIGAVVAVGVLMQVMMSGLAGTLDQTRLTYYDRYRMADIYVPLTRAPERMLDRLAALPGVTGAASRVSGSALIDLPSPPGTPMELPVRAQALSLPDLGTPRFNDIYLTAGQMPRPGHGGEALLLRGFAAARGIAPGDRIEVTLNGARRSLRITGLARAPEFLYTTAPGEMIPDDRRFAVIWMRRAALSAAYDMQGAFNQALLSIDTATDPQSVIAAADLLTARYGGAGSYDLSDLPSNFFVSEEIGGLRTISRTIPPVFMLVAAFLLYIVIARMVQAEREQIGLLKAFGYSDMETSVHYLKLVLVIAIGGAAVGALGGIAAGNGMAVLYQSYFKFPFLVFTLDPQSFVIGFAASIFTACAGSLFVLRRVFRLTPAVAMRPPSPPDYARSAGRRRQGHGHGHAKPRGMALDQPTRMVLRRLTRYPGRMGGAVLGIATGLGISIAQLTAMNGFDVTIDRAFNVMNQADMSVNFLRPLSQKTLLELARIKGVTHAEPTRIIAAELRNGTHVYKGSVEGRPALPQLTRLLDSAGNPVALRSDGVILSKPLAEILHLSPGQTVQIELREGRRPVLNLPVVGVTETLLGAPAFAEIGALTRWLKEPGQITGADLRFDAAQRDQIVETLKSMPYIAGIAMKEDSRAALVEIMDTGPGSVRYVMLFLAAVITFGIVYNAARIALAERSRDLASLRVMGFTRSEAAFVLLGELGIVTLAAIPLGIGMGYGLTYLIVAGFSTDIYQIPVVFAPQNYGVAVLAVLAAAGLSGWLVRRDLRKIDMVAALKTRD